MNPILQTNSLTKVYGDTSALDKVSLCLQPGRIYGLIGQNGSGKTTLMRIIAGLAFPTGGSLELFGCLEEKQIHRERKRLGCLIEYPSFIPSMTAKDNLRLHRIMRGIPNEEIEDELLNIVGLTDACKKKAKDFSLGMKQRLGIALALLGDPEFLILDEPINGLDPLGVVEIRNLLKKLCQEKHKTILISSHNLPELYQIATDYIVIHQGEIKEIITLQQLEEHCQHYLRLECDNLEKLAAIIETKLGTENYKVMPDGSLRLYDYLDDRETIMREFFENGIIITNCSREGDSLEDYFISVIGGVKNV
ncbi:ABC transporter ATP-binding protein [Candidatus Methanomassiliicoccus intestinalis]|uniref:ABC transporter ATP-binding protein n=1 Tax=Candidatus Methanomassiliicoccus intestinalis TaxID=1406512 RepID=UPI0037DBFDF8